jgi:acyl-coenzyme A thioesterase PaaI-like protein
VQIGEFVEAKCEVVRRTRSLIFMNAELVVGDRVVATAKGIWKALGKPKPA